MASYIAIPYSKKSAMSTLRPTWPRCSGFHSWSVVTLRRPYPTSLSLPITLVHMWCMSLWDFFQSSELIALSHSHVVEWISGSRIQSHWPCMMLCPSSMFSRILATDSIAVPAIQAGGKIEAISVARADSSSAR